MVNLNKDVIEIRDIIYNHFVENYIKKVPVKEFPNSFESFFDLYCSANKYISSDEQFLKLCENLGGEKIHRAFASYLRACYFFYLFSLHSEYSKLVSEYLIRRENFFEAGYAVEKKIEELLLNKSLSYKFNLLFLQISVRNLLGHKYRQDCIIGGYLLEKTFGGNFGIEDGFILIGTSKKDSNRFENYIYVSKCVPDILPRLIVSYRDVVACFDGNLRFLYRSIEEPTTISETHFIIQLEDFSQMVDKVNDIVLCKDIMEIYPRLSYAVNYKSQISRFGLI